MLDQVDIPFLLALRAEWRQAPPERYLLAGLARYKPPPEARPSAAGAQPGEVSIAMLKAAFPNGRL